MGRPKLGSYRYGITSLCCKPAVHEEAERPEVRPKWTHFTEFLRCKVLVDAAAGISPSQDGFMLQEKWTQGCSCRKTEQYDEAVPYCLRGRIK